MMLEMQLDAISFFVMSSRDSADNLGEDAGQFPRGLPHNESAQCKDAAHIIRQMKATSEVVFRPRRPVG